MSRHKIGVLALQGGVLEHISHLKALGIDAVQVKTHDQFDELAGLILPGGESTCLVRLLDFFKLKEKIQDAFNDGMKIWGTCAGSILIANKLTNTDGYLKFIDIEVERNAFGFQVDSFNKKVSVPQVSDKEINLTFIRAPKIKSVGDNVNVLLQIDDYIAAAEDDNCLATIFHPELTPSLAFHKYFAEKCGLKVENEVEDNQHRTTWMQFSRITTPQMELV